MAPSDVFDTYSQYFGYYKSSGFDKFMDIVKEFGLSAEDGETSPYEIDILTGLKKDSTDKHQSYILDPTSVSLSAAEGVPLLGGSMGSFADTTIAEGNELTNGQIAMNARLAKAYNGEITNLIYDEIRYPFMHLFNPSDDIAVMNAVSDLAAKRNISCACLGLTPTKTYTDAQSLRSSTFLGFNTFKDSVYCESAMIVDQYTGRRIRMPAQYFNAYSYASHCLSTGFSLPFAGEYFKWTGFIAGTMQPQSTSSDVYIANHKLRMNTMVEDGKGIATSYEQINCQSTISNLSEINNVHILLRMVRVAIEFAKAKKWTPNLSTEAIGNFQRDLKDLIGTKLGGMYDSVDISTKREAVNGAGRNRIKCIITVKFHAMLKGVSYDFYIV